MTAEDNTVVGLKQRAANLTAVDRGIIVELATQYQHIIENKKTDAITNAEKETAWKAVETEFNAVSAQKRNSQQLKQAYENFKKRAKKSLANDRVQCFKTGGGTFVSQVDAVDEKLIAVLGNRATSLHNPFDCDADWSQVLSNSEMTSCLLLPADESQCEDALISLPTELDVQQPSCSYKTTSLQSIVGSCRTTPSQLIVRVGGSFASESVVQSCSTGTVPSESVITIQPTRSTAPESGVRATGLAPAAGYENRNRKWAGRRRPRVARVDSVAVHADAAAKFASLADDKRAYYAAKLSMKQLEHEQRMKVLKLREQFYARQLQQFEE